MHECHDFVDQAQIYNRFSLDSRVAVLLLILDMLLKGCGHLAIMQELDEQRLNVGCRYLKTIEHFNSEFECLHN